VSDFAQSGLISTLQRLNGTHLPQIEGELCALARERPIALVLPCHGSDLVRPAFAHIVSELRDAKWLHEILLATNAATDEALAGARSLLADLGQRHRILRTDARDQASTHVSGKGANLHAAFVATDAEIIATQDCDVASFERADLARLCYAVAHPELGYRFAKAYYSRVTDRLYGRVSRLFFSPLLHAVVRVAGHHPLVDFLISFRYPLAGEVALTRELAAQLPIARGWNVELSHLCEVFRRVDPREVCQVDGGTGYDHKHQPATTALAGMAREIARELFAQLRTEGIALDPGALTGAYRREASHALRRSAALAKINRIPFDTVAERSIVETFAEGLDQML
jgi:glucosyl-3-phosphoglycerate synthase